METLVQYPSVGLAFEELSFEEMAISQGSGDLEVMSGPPCFLLTAGSALLVTFVWC
ncbi:mersacidin family lantibiotic [Paenibacillus albidus]|uniref:mersacidin family lantibiotic n=1 Tax=Paenibacillus albidus TaxID=2041023 RepID=UPI00288C03AF|nr:mersacidin family lantibiotic [Paenibacillus albidus]